MSPSSYQVGRDGRKGKGKERDGGSQEMGQNILSVARDKNTNSFSCDFKHFKKSKTETAAALCRWDRNWFSKCFLMLLYSFYNR